MNKALRVGLLLLLVLVLPPAAAQGEGERPAAPAAPGQAERALSEREVLVLAGRLLEQGRADAAAVLLRVLMAQGRNPEHRIEAAFQLAGIAGEAGKYREAVNLYQNILNQRPDLPRVRLELARAYFLDKNYEDAAFQFELVKGGDLPPEVLANVDMFLDAIRRQKNWTLDFSLSPVFDSNTNQASGGREECIDTAVGPLCRTLEDKASGLGLSANATLDYFRRFHQDWGLRSTLGFYGTAYEESEYNDYILYAATGPRYLWDSGEASLQPFFRKRWIGDKEYSEEYGLRLDARQIYGRLLLNAGASFASAGYADAYVHSVLQGQSWNAYLQPRYILTDRAFIQAGLDFLREETRERAYANDNWRYSIGVYQVFPYGISLFLEGSLMQTKYQAPQWYVTRDNRIDEATRKDQTWRFLASFSSTALEEYGLTPVLQYSYTKRDSNIWTREYDRHRLNLLVNYRF